MVLDFNQPHPGGLQMAGRFLDHTGTFRDSFTIIKGAPVGVDPGFPADDPGGVALRLEPPQPNPSGGTTRLSFVLETAARVRLSILDAAGRRVRVLAGELRAAGRHAILWDGRDAGGQSVPPGVYYAVVHAGGRIAARKLLLLH